MPRTSRFWIRARETLRLQALAGLHQCQPGPDRRTTPVAYLAPMTDPECWADAGCAIALISASDHFMWDELISALTAL